MFSRLLFNKHRLIQIYEKIGRKGKFDPEYHGIVGLVDVPYSIIDPSFTWFKVNFIDY
jgi:hypothetical protein